MAEEAKRVQIPEFRRSRVNIRIKGDTPLIVNRFGDLPMAAIEEAQGPKTGVKMPLPPRVPMAEAEDKLYRLRHDTERFGFPAGGIKLALVNAGYRMADETMTVLKACVQIKAEFIEIESPNPWRMRKDMVKLQGRTATLAYRPEFWTWEMNVPVSFVPWKLSLEQVVSLFEMAGDGIGIGDWRPEKDGVFGQFSVLKAA